ncbi:unnamed protein product [Spodoptera exigua]|nr:unnamed protein product [Spodoptera exigua]
MASCIIPFWLFVVVLTTVSAAPPDEKPLKCPEGEYYIKCSLAECVQKCDHLRHPPACPSLLPTCYSPACLCNEGYLRNSKGKCISKSECYRELFN